MSSFLVAATNFDFDSVQRVIVRSPDGAKNQRVLLLSLVWERGFVGKCLEGDQAGYNH
jgi:hypothetical protein